MTRFLQRGSAVVLAGLLATSESTAQCLADFDGAPLSGPASLTVQFTDLSIGDIDRWSWDFGDGSTSGVADPSHVYDQPGAYTVSLTVSGPCGTDTAVRTDLITVDPLPPGFIDEFVTTFPTTATGFRVLAGGDVVAWLKAGKVLWWVDGSWGPAPLVDISEEVANWNDHGLHGFCFDPDYAGNGHVYLYYAVDRHHLDHFGTPAYDPQMSSVGVETIARITRYTVFDPRDPLTTVDPRSRLVLVGEDITSGIPICATSHGVGWMEFGHDGSLLFSTGDSSLGGAFQAECLDAGIFRPAEDVGAFRAQLLNGASGKLHRIDPATGAGMDDNPFFSAARPESWQSRVWACGLRNPYGFAVRPDDEEHGSGPGTVYVGDVGNTSWEELSVVVDGGANLGWPLFEGVLAYPPFYFQDLENLDAPNPLYPQGGCGPYLLFEELLVDDALFAPSWPNPCDPAQQVTSTATHVHTRPVLTWGHRSELSAPVTYVPGHDAPGNPIAIAIESTASPVAGSPFYGNASIGGAFLGGTAFPLKYRDVYFHADFGEGWIKALAFDPDDRLLAVHEFASGLGNVPRLAADPEQTALYYLRYGGGTQLRKISYGGNAAPVARIAATPSFGASPLCVSLSAAASSDPEGTSLLVDWDFGDGGSWTPLANLSDTAHVYPSVDVTAAAVQIVTSAGPPTFARVDPVPLSSAAVTGGRPPGLGVIHDGEYPAPGSPGDAGQVIVERPGSGIGYRLGAPRGLVALVFQEGLDTGPRGGWLAAPAVDVRDPNTGAWRAVSGLEVHPGHPGDPAVGYETFLLSFDTAVSDAVRLRDAAAGAGPGAFTVAELRVLALPDPAPSGPGSFVPVLTVTDEGGLASGATALVSPDNTPPEVTIVSPAPGQTYPVGVASRVPLEAVLEDAEHLPETLACEWRIDLVHGSHTHPEPPDTSCSSSFTLLPHGELQGQPIHWRFELSVTDPAGLTTKAVTTMLPEGDCNLNGIDDALDIASGVAVDRNGNGVPDSCEWRALQRPPGAPVAR